MNAGRMVQKPDSAPALRVRTRSASTGYSSILPHPADEDETETFEPEATHAQTAAKLRLMLVDEQILLLSGLRAVLESEFEVVAVLPSLTDAVQQARILRPDMIITDWFSTGLTTPEAVRQIRRDVPEAKVIVMSMHSTGRHVREAFEAGVVAYVSKRSQIDSLLTAIREVLAGSCYVSSNMLREALAPNLDPVNLQPAVRLSKRQIEVLRLLAEGMSMKETAGVLNISIKTVELHRHVLLRKLGLRSSVDLTKYAIKQGLTRL